MSRYEYPEPRVEMRDPLRFSDLKHIAQSPAHYLHARKRQRGKGSREMLIGSAAHSLVLGGKEVVVYPGKVRRGKAWDAFEAEHPDALILLTSEEYDARRCAQSVLSNRDAMALLEGEREKELPIWSMAGRRCGGRPDVVNPAKGFISELKTSASAAPWRFTRMGIRLGYPAQASWYRTGAGHAGVETHTSYIVTVETHAPYVVTLFRLTNRAILFGERCWSSWFERLLVCEASNEWPPYAQHIVDFDSPEEETELTFGDDDGGGEGGEEEEALARLGEYTVAPHDGVKAHEDRGVLLGMIETYQSERTDQTSEAAGPVAEAPYVCPGCHAVGGEKCAPSCIDAEIEAEQREAIESGDYDRGEEEDES